MDSATSCAETTPPSSASSPFCQRNKSENGSFVTELRHRYHAFIHASMNEHKACLKMSFQKAYDRLHNFLEKSSSPGKGATSQAPSTNSTADAK